MTKKVKNINGISINVCVCGSWLKHWEVLSHEKPGLCSEKNCPKIAVIGAHVKKTDPTDTDWYIIPLCEKHNSLTGQEIEIGDSIQLVPANTDHSLQVF